MQQAILNGGTYARRMSRGGAKTTRSEGAARRGGLYGRIRFAILAGASKEAAADSYETIKYEIESNDLLLEDFPEVCLPVRKLEGKPQRAVGMLSDGAEIRFERIGRQLVFPATPGSKSAGAILRATGYGGRLRGQKFHAQRPDFLILDDIQKDAAAPPRNVQRDLTILQSTIKGMKNRGGKFTVLVPGTRLNPHCFMSQTTDRQKFPDYQRRIFKATPKMPQNLDLWQEYRKIWIQGASVAWADNPDESEKKPETAAYLRRKNPALSFQRASVSRFAGAPTRNRAYAAAILISEGGLTEPEVQAAGKFTDDEMTRAESRAFRGATYGGTLAEVYERSAGRAYRGQKDDVASFAMRGILAPRR